MSLDLYDTFEIISSLENFFISKKYKAEASITANQVPTVELVITESQCIASLMIFDLNYIDIYAYKDTSTLNGSFPFTEYKDRPDGNTLIFVGQVRFESTGKIKSDRNKLADIKFHLTDKERDTLDRLITEFSYFIKPNSIKFIMDWKLPGGNKWYE